LLEPPPKLLARAGTPAGEAGGAATAVAIQAVAESVTATRFEGSRAESDECVLKKILDVLVACVACPAGPLLSDDSLIGLFQACYQVGHYQTEKGKDTSGTQSQRGAASASSRPAQL
jgi:brefeldin A-resistance guanine nucleotide exchange factor 1